MKYFISQKMNGLSDEEILKERNRIINAIKDDDKDAEIIDSFLKKSGTPVEMLGESIKLLAQSDVIYLPLDIENTRGCKVEKQVAELYGIEIRYIK